MAEYFGFGSSTKQSIGLGGERIINHLAASSAGGHQLMHVDPNQCQPMRAYAPACCPYHRRIIIIVTNPNPAPPPPRPFFQNLFSISSASRGAISNAMRRYGKLEAALKDKDAVIESLQSENNAIRKQLLQLQSQHRGQTQAPSPPQTKPQTPNNFNSAAASSRTLW
jgi:hypothetical protein